MGCRLFFRVVPLREVHQQTQIRRSVSLSGQFCQALSLGLAVTHATTSTTVDSATSQGVATRTSAGSASVPTLSLSARSVALGEARPLPLSVVSPINIGALRFYLRDHPCRRTVDFVLNGFGVGFDIGFVGLVSATRPNNLLSARHSPGPVSAAIRKEVSRGTRLGHS